MATSIQSSLQNNTLVCRNPVPEIQSGIILERTYVPPSITYGCYSGFISEGDKKRYSLYSREIWGNTEYQLQHKYYFCTFGFVSLFKIIGKY